MLRCLSVGLVTLTLLARASLSQTTGNLSGTVTDQTGKSIGGILITAVRVALPPASGTATSDAAGRFLVQNLPAGPYKICTQSPNGQHLDPCFWTDHMAGPAFTAAVAAGQTSAGPTIKLQRAATLQVRFNDPQQLLTKPSTNVTVDVMTPSGVYFRARIVSADSGGRLAEAPIPSEQLLHVLITPVGLGLIDSANSVVPNVGAVITASHPAASTSPTLISYTISQTL